MWSRHAKALDIGVHVALIAIVLFVIVVWYAGAVDSWNGWVGASILFTLSYGVITAVLLAFRGRGHRASVSLDFTWSVFALILLVYSFQVVTFESRQLPALYASEPYISLFRLGLLFFAVLGQVAGVLTELRYHGRFDLRSYIPGQLR